jgi:hypothetical protein
MRIETCLRSVLVVALAWGILLLGPAGNVARAERVSTAAVLDARAEQRAHARVRAFLARDDVREQLRGLGVDPAEAEARVASLSDAEAQALAGRLDTLHAGGDAIGVIVGAALLVFLVLLLTDILGLTDVFNFVKKPVDR